MVAKKVFRSLMVVKDFRLYDENSSSKGRSPAAHIAKRRVRVSQPLAVPLIFAEINYSTPGGECQKNACATR